MGASKAETTAAAACGGGGLSSPSPVVVDWLHLVLFVLPWQNLISLG